MRNIILTAAVAMAVAAGTARWPQPQTSPGSNTTQAAADFEAQVQRYVELHRSLEGSVPTVAISEDYAQVLAAIDALAAKIRAARKDARRGEIFTPAIDCWFRDMIDASLEGCDTRAILAWLNEENPPDVVLAPKINGRWPDGASHGPMPPKLLADLPRLPDELQYRILDGDLVLWDVHANLIVDFIRRVLP